MADAEQQHPEDRQNTRLLIAARRGDQIELSWPDDLGLARYLWRKLGTAIAEAEYFDAPKYQLDDEALGAEIVGETIQFFGPADLRVAKWMHARLGAVLDDKEWELHRQALKVQHEIARAAQQRVKIGDARDLRRFKGGRN